MLDPAEFQMPESTNQDNSTTPTWHHLPAVLQLIERGPGNREMLVVSEARLYCDDVTGRERNQDRQAENNQDA